MKRVSASAGANPPLREILLGLERDGPSAGTLRSLRRRMAGDPASLALLGIGWDAAWDVVGRATLYRACADLCPSVQMEVAGHPVRAQLAREGLWCCYLPLVQVALSRWSRLQRRVLVGIAGAGASGKSVFAALISRILNRVGGIRAAVCALDGFHYPNAYLDAHHTTLEDGERVPLRRVKGSPASFDVGAFVQALRDLREQEEVRLPRYDRKIHDPVPDAVRIGTEVGIVLVEGNYLLLDDGQWSQIGDLLDMRLFIDVPQQELRRAMVERHVAGGRSAQEARRYYERVDRRNAELILLTAVRADIVLHRDARQRLVGMTPAP